MQIYVKGILFSLVFAVPAYFLGKLFPLVGGPVFGILLGILFAGFKRSESFEAGIKFTGKKILQYSIILLGFEMNLLNVLHVGAQSFSVMIFTLLTSFFIAWIVGKWLHLDKDTTTLIGAGTAICGGSAIAAVAPVIGAKDKDIAFSISTIFLFNIIAVFLFPFLGHLMGMSNTGFGMWAGTAINDTSSVVAAGYSYSTAAGSYATIVKLTRALMIVPVCLLFAAITAREKSKNSNFKISKIFPWFILWFVVASIINTLGFLPAQITQFLGAAGKFCIILAMSAIGLNTNLKSLVKNGIRPIFLGLCCWFAVAIVSLIVQHIIGLI
ncbi:YeiH family protein [Pectinatus brassicae]|uniref:Putative integral membrane protein (TIGR00698 family) n=1 Tax=Pectinatus brassicae TaxID=862415 RepID=A0A840UK45_9FIRM|nr:YeiH family protein [Pectinatus brassicae]MBB5336017.1 putative integral membrane protein (TIGR00698 family) [Pectinatus brassicae]